MQQRLFSIIVIIALIAGIFPFMPANHASALDANLKLWYKFDETSGTTAADSSGNNNNGTLSAAGATFSGMGAVQLNGSNGSVQMPNNLLSGVTNVTVTTKVFVNTANARPSWIFSFGTAANAGSVAGTKYLGLIPADNGSGNGSFRFSITTDRWTAEQSATRSGVPLAKGVWKNIALTMSLNSANAKYTGILYENGVEIARNAAMTIAPKDLGTTLYNYIGRPAYSGDKWFNGEIDDFRLYDRALSPTELRSVMFENLSDSEAIQIVKPQVDLGDISAIKANMTLPTAFEGGVTVVWGSNNESVIENNGTVHRSPDADTIVHLTATISKGIASDTKVFTVNVLQYKTIYTLDSTGYTLPYINATHSTVLTAFYPDGGEEDVTAQATIVSSDPTVATVDAAGIVRGIQEGSATITLTYLGIANMINVKVVKEANLKLWYKMNETNGTTAVDSSGNGKHGTLSSGATWSTGKAEAGAVQFNGTNGFVKIPDNILSGITDITVSTNLWVDPANNRPSWAFTFGNLENAASDGKYLGYLPADNGSGNGNSRFAISTNKWTTEQTASRAGIPLNKGVWKNISLTISGTMGILYEDGIEMARNTAMTIDPKDIGNTLYNYIGKPAYAADSYFKGKVSDFRIYDRALSPAEIQGIAQELAFQDIILDKAALTLGNTEGVKSNLILPNLGANGSVITWMSSNTSRIDNAGNINRPAMGAGDTTATLTATITKAGLTDHKVFTVTILQLKDDLTSVTLDTAELSLGNDITALKHDLVLPAIGTEVSTISWASSNDSVVNPVTGAVHRPEKGSPNASVTLTATITKGMEQAHKVFEVTVAAKETYAGYLLSYFKAADESLYQAYSRDGLHWTALNKNQSVLKVSIGNKSVRDPDVIRGQDGVYHFLSTDSWNSTNLLIYDSTDLVHWTNGRIVPFAPGNSTDAWAPEAYYDHANNNYVVIWASKIPGNPVSNEHRMYYRTTTDFIHFSDYKLFADPGHDQIDATVIEDDGKYYTYYKDERAYNAATMPSGKGIKMAVSTTGLIGTYDTASYPNAVIAPQVEGPIVIKSFTENKWYMYVDGFNSGTYPGYTTTDLASGIWTKMGAGDFQLPTGIRHSNIMEITEDEINTLLANYVTMTEIPELHIELEVGDVPVLPSSVNAIFSDGSTSSVNVTWAAMTLDQYQSAGSFEVAGTVVDSAVKPVATISIVSPVVKRPTGLIPVTNNASSISLTWTAVPEATGYNVYRSTSLYGIFNKVNNSTNETNAYTDTELSAGTTYYYAVTAMNNNGESIKSISVMAITGPDSINSGPLWYDNNSAVIQAHGGGVMYDENTQKYYWYGEDKTDGWIPARGVRAYSSTDLYNWKDEGLVLTAISSMAQFTDGSAISQLYTDRTDTADIFNDIGTNRIIERPKVIYNDTTHKYVMWMHTDGPTDPNSTSVNYGKAEAGYALSDSPTGPFVYQASYRMDRAPAGQTDYQPGNPGMARDMTLFKDDDGTAYLIYSSEENLSIYISKLNDTYTDVTGWHKDGNVARDITYKAVYGVDYIRVFPGAQREAPAMFKYKGKYYLMTSGATGWAPNQAAYTVADSVFGTWKAMRNPSVGTKAGTTFDSQSTYVIPVDPENGKFIFMGDRWNSSDLKNSRYIWLPIEFGQDDEIILRWYDNWKLELLDRMGKYTVNSELPKTVKLGETPNLPGTINISVGGTTIDTIVAWSMNTEDFSKPGVIQVKGTLTELANKMITIEMYVIPENVIYFVNSGGALTNDYSFMTSKMQNTLLNKDVIDQMYDPLDGKTWGYVGSDTSTSGTSSGDIYSSLRYLLSNKGDDLSYKFELENGDYAVYTGFYDPWYQYSKGNRIADIQINGVNKQSGFVFTDAYNAFGFNNITVTDGLLQLTVHRAATAGTSSSDPQISWIIIVAKPAAPSGLAIGAVTDSTVQLSWSAVYGADSYNVYRSDSENGPYTQVNISPVTATSFSDTGLSADTTYYYQITAVNRAGQSAPSTAANALTDAVIPEAPTSLTAIANGVSSVNLSWTASKRADSYNVYRSDSENGTYTQVNVSPLTVTSFSATGLSTDTTYYYQITAVNRAGQSGPSTAANALTDIVIPEAPASLTAIESGVSSVNLSWTVSTRAVSYNVYRSDSEKGTYTQVNVTPVTVTSFSDTGLSEHTKFYYKVTAVNRAGESVKSSAIKVKTNKSDNNGNNGNN